nr:hypothetical protein [Photorhabdus laumondii]
MSPDESLASSELLVPRELPLASLLLLLLLILLILLEVVLQVESRCFGEEQEESEGGEEKSELRRH